MTQTTFTKDFGAVDTKGRKIGALVTWDTAGDQYTMRVHATRDGKSYGPGQPLQRFANAALRLKGCNKYLAAAEKRAKAKAK